MDTVRPSQRLRSFCASISFGRLAWLYTTGCPRSASPEVHSGEAFSKPLQWMVFRRDRLTGWQRVFCPLARWPVALEYSAMMTVRSAEHMHKEPSLALLLTQILLLDHEFLALLNFLLGPSLSQAVVSLVSAAECLNLAQRYRRDDAGARRVDSIVNTQKVCSYSWPQNDRD